MKSFVRTAAAVLALAAPAQAEVFTVDVGHSDVSFQVRHFVSKVRGRFKQFEGRFDLNKAKPEASTVEFTIKAASIDTENENRDNDLRGPNFFEVEKFPDITFKSSKIVARGQDRYDVTGTFTMKGVSKEITLPVSVLGTMKDARGERAAFETATVLNRKDYGLVWNRALDNGGFMLGDEVSVSVNLALVWRDPNAPPPPPRPGASPAASPAPAAPAPSPSPRS